VSYTHGGGIDRPLALHKEGWQSILPHENWRGQFAGTCVPDATVPCGTPQWPGWQTNAYHYGTTPPQNEAWHGSLVDDMRDATGQMYKRNRYYDPQTGQFTQPDPIGIAGGLNVYGFAAGDPVSYSDPYGLCKRHAGLRRGEIGICIETFIAGPSAGVPRSTADNRSFSGTGGSYRTSDRFIVQSDGRVRNTSQGVGSTFGFIPGIGIPNHTYAMEGTKTTIFASVDSGTLSPWPPFNINYQFEISVDGGNVSVEGSHDGFPSYEIWVYEEGKDPRMVYGHRETNAMDLRGCCDTTVKQ
jgi:RHS repeat-associated protein